MYDELKKVCEEILSDETKTKEFLAMSSIEEMYNFFKSKIPNLSTSEFDDFIVELLENYERMQLEGNTIDAEMLQNVSGGAKFGSKVTATSLALLMGVSAGGTPVSATDSNNKFSSAMNSVGRKISNTSDRYGKWLANILRQQGFKKTGDWFEKHSGFASAASAVMALLVVAGVTYGGFKLKKRYFPGAALVDNAGKGSNGSDGEQDKVVKETEKEKDSDGKEEEKDDEIVVEEEKKEEKKDSDGEGQGEEEEKKEEKKGSDGEQDEVVEEKEEEKEEEKKEEKKDEVVEETEEEDGEDKREDSKGSDGEEEKKEEKKEEEENENHSDKPGQGTLPDDVVKPSSVVTPETNQETLTEEKPKNEKKEEEQNDDTQKKTMIPGAPQQPNTSEQSSEQPSEKPSDSSGGDGSIGSNP